MDVNINWSTKVISVDKSELELIQSTPTEVYNMSLNEFRLALKDKEDDLEGITFLDTHSHNTEVLLGGIVYARVLQIINGYTVTFQDGQYAVNLIGANSNVGDNVNVNQVSLRSANSAGLISNQAIEFSSFDGAITIDADNITGRSKFGTVFPAGTLQQPVTTLAELKLIASSRGFNKVRVVGNLTIKSGQTWSGFSFEGESQLKTVITIENAASVLNCEFSDATITGALDGNSQIENCVIDDLDFVDGFIYKCSLGPSIIELGTSIVANIFSCYSTVPGNLTPFIDMNSTGILALRDYNGGMTLQNYSGSGGHSIDLASGQIVLENTITIGTFVVRGIGKLVDASGNNIYTGTWNSGVTIINELVQGAVLNESLVWSRNSSKNAEEANLKL